MLTIDLEKTDPSILCGHLKMGGTNPTGVEINANSRYLTIGGVPWSPVMGEFHFSRVPMADWETELRKMKAGGIDILATYIFWIHHEEIEASFEWEGNRNLRHLVELCAEVGLYCYPRLGPWAHGECRNGGFPDWLLAKCGTEVRKDAPLYLSYVKRLYGEIAVQLTGLLWKDGGPVVGVQLENELIKNAPHILTLKGLAREAGIDVPLYTMTGWGPADVPQDEVIPVFGGYPDAFWDLQATDWARESRKAYCFSLLRDDNAIGADLIKLGTIGDLSYMSRYPYGTCETGGGIQVAYRRRPEVTTDDIAALGYMKVGNGSNLLGYYMYHGGAHPIGKLTTMQESQGTGYPNDLPVINYDFQAPLGEFGQVRPSFHALRPLHLFLQSFGSDLAPMPMALPEDQPTGLDDRETLRWAVRSNSHTGFIFINNYQRVESLPTHLDVQFQLNLSDEIMVVPQTPVVIPSGMYGIWPVNMNLDGAVLKYATMQPISRLTHNGEDIFVFGAMTGVVPEFAFENDSIKSISPASGDSTDLHSLRPGTSCALRVVVDETKTVQMLVLSPEQARQLYKLTLWGKEYVVLCTELVYTDSVTLHLQTRKSGEVSFAIYPQSERPLTVNGVAIPAQQDGIFTRYTVSIPEHTVHVSVQQVQPAGRAQPIISKDWGAIVPPDSAFDAAEVWQVSVPADVATDVAEAYLCVSYVGDIGRAYIGDRLIDDDFYFGRTWEIGLKRFVADLGAQPITLKFLPLRRDAPVYIPVERRPDFGEREQIVHVGRISVEVEYAIEIRQA